MSAAEAYIAGWKACMAGHVGRYWFDRPADGNTEETKYAWDNGFLDAMEAEDGEEPQPECAGYY